MKPIERLAPGVILLTGAGIDAARYAALVAIRARRRNGQPDSADLAALLDACESPTGQPDNDNTEADDSDYVTTEVAAEQLECSPRHARRLAPALGGKRLGGRWFIDQRCLTEHLEGRTTA